MASEQDQKSLTTIAVDWARENVGSTWATPRASDGEKGGPNQSFGAGGVPLPAQAAKWMTPRANENSESVAGYQARRMAMPPAVRPGETGTLSIQVQKWCTKAGQTTVPLYLEEVATSLFHHLDPTTSTLGEPSSPSDPTSPPLSLNPLFVAWLMNWIVPASTNSGWAEMGSTLYAERMRFELSRLASPPAAPLVQPDLFS